MSQDPGALRHDISTAKKVLVAGSRRFCVIHYRFLAVPAKVVVPGRQQERFATELKLKLDEGFGLVRNVSASGVYFLTDIALRVGQSVMLRLEFENFPGGPISVDCIARIVRVEDQGATKGFGAAISSFEFSRIHDPDNSSGKKG
jgi:hypothetical protein